MATIRLTIIAILLCCFICNNIGNTQANVNHYQDEQHGHRSWTWTQYERDQLDRMSQKLRTELSSSRPYYGQRCNEVCFTIPELVGRGQEEYSQIARDMTSQIAANLQSGRLMRSQMNQPNWYENQAQKMLDLRYHHQEEYERNVNIARGRLNGKFGRQEEHRPHTTVVNETLQQKLREIGVGKMCEQEVQQTIATGVFIRGGNKFVYDSVLQQYEKIQIGTEERQNIFFVVEKLLRQLGHRLLTQKENENFLINGHFIRDAHQWIYNIVDQTVAKTIFVGDFAEFTDDEYRKIYQKIQDTLRRTGYKQMSESECNATIRSGTFERGGIFRTYNPVSEEFEMRLLSLSEYRHRKQILRHELRRLGHRELSNEEFGKLIYRGYFYHEGYRYEYIISSGRYERIELTTEQYRDRLRQLKEQLAMIGYGAMTEAECNATITSGKFNYGGYEWVYDFEAREYEKGNKSENDTNSDCNQERRRGATRGDQRPRCMDRVDDSSETSATEEYSYAEFSTPKPARSICVFRRPYQPIKSQPEPIRL